MKASFLVLALALISAPMTAWTSPASEAADEGSCRAALMRLTLGARQAAFTKVDVANKAREIAEQQTAIDRKIHMSGSKANMTPFDQDILRIQETTVEASRTTLEMLKAAQTSQEKALSLLISIAEGACLIEGAKHTPKR